MENTKYYKASDGKVFKRIIDDFIMGKDLYLGQFIDGTVDTIENYIEVNDESSTLFDLQTDNFKNDFSLGNMKLGMFNEF